jgi:transposase InsO family protein
LTDLAQHADRFRFLIRDRDAKFTPAFDTAFDTVFTAAGIQLVKIPPRAPQANAYAERWVRTVRVKCLDWLLIRNRHHLHHVLDRYLTHYNAARPHRTLDLTTPIPAPPSPPATMAQIRRIHRDDIPGGLIHKYRHAA